MCCSLPALPCAGSPPAGNRAVLLVNRDFCIFRGEAEDLKAARRGCLNPGGAKRMPDKEFVLGNKTKDLLVYTFIVTKPISDKTLELPEVIEMLTAIRNLPPEAPG